MHFAAAASEDSAWVSDLLLEKGADVNARTNDGRTPVHIAFRHSSLPTVIDALVESGADVNAKDKVGKTAFMVAIPPPDPSKKWGSRPYSTDQPFNPESTHRLLYHGADAAAKDNQGLTAAQIYRGALHAARAKTLEYEWPDGLYVLIPLLEDPVVLDRLSQDELLTVALEDRRQIVYSPAIDMLDTDGLRTVAQQSTRYKVERAIRTLFTRNDTLFTVRGEGQSQYYTKSQMLNAFFDVYKGIQQYLWEPDVIRRFGNLRLSVSTIISSKVYYQSGGQPHPRTATRTSETITIKILDDTGGTVFEETFPGPTLPAALLTDKRSVHLRPAIDLSKLLARIEVAASLQ